MAVPIVDEARSIRDALNVPTMGYLILLITPLAIGLSTLLTPEPMEQDRPAQRVCLFEPIGLLRRPTLQRLVLAELCVAVGPGWMSALFLFYFTDSRGFSIGQASLLLAAYFLAGLVGAPAAGVVATRLSKHRTLMVFAAAYVATVLCFALIPRGNLPVAAVCLFIAGGMGTGLTTLTRAMMADVADEIRLEQDRQWTGVLYAMIVMAQKVGSACSIAITFFILDRVGFRPALGAHNTPGALHRLDFVFLSGPVAFVTLGAICILGYALTAERHAHIRRQLDVRDGVESPTLDLTASPAAPRDATAALAPDAATASAANPAA
jgi:Na+/melibiose symporter-like transporter